MLELSGQELTSDLFSTEVSEKARNTNYHMTHKYICGIYTQWNLIYLKRKKLNHEISDK